MVRTRKSCVIIIESASSGVLVSVSKVGRNVARISLAISLGVVGKGDFLNGAFRGSNRWLNGVVIFVRWVGRILVDCYL